LATAAKERIISAVKVTCWMTESPISISPTSSRRDGVSSVTVRAPRDTATLRLGTLSFLDEGRHPVDRPQPVEILLRDSQLEAILDSHQDGGEIYGIEAAFEKRTAMIGQVHWIGTAYVGDYLD
jgi:hypothetical protein